AYRLILFPLGIFSTALSQAILPSFSTLALDDNYDKLKDTLTFGLRATFFVMLPASAGLMVLSGPIITTLFKGGRFDAYSAGITSNILFYYSIGLFAYGATRIVQSCFFALKDTVTPAKIGLLTLIINVVLNASLIFPMKLRGIALANSISGIVTFFVLFYLLKKKIRLAGTGVLITSFLRILCASIGMGIVCYLLRGANLILTIIAAMLSYIIFCVAFKVEELDKLWKLFKARR
ncbi:MAG: lipid II flippase MurJ, partial [Candidatus Omnitrophota bacterium]